MNVIVFRDFSTPPIGSGRNDGRKTSGKNIKPTHARYIKDKWLTAFRQIVSRKDKLFGKKKTDCLGVFLFRATEIGRCHAVLSLEAAVERDRVGKAARLANLLDAHLGMLI